MNTVTYKGKDYKTRTFNVLRDGNEETITIAPVSLSDALGDAKEHHHSPEEEIDSEIYFYILDEEIDMDADHICENLLDEPCEFVDEEN